MGQTASGTLIPKSFKTWIAMDSGMPSLGRGGAPGSRVRI